MKSPAEAAMEEYQAPMTRDEYLHWNGMGKTQKIDAETEAELPKRFAYPVISHEELEHEKDGLGAPSDFAGPVIPNPKGVRPTLDSDRPEPSLMDRKTKPTMRQHREESMSTNPVIPNPDNSVPGLITPGNIDLNNRPVIKNADGSISTEKSFSRETDDGEVLVPQVVNGKMLSQDAAWDHYRKTGEHMGIFDTPEAANSYAQQTHNRPAMSPDQSHKPQYVMSMNSSKPMRVAVPISNGPAVIPQIANPQPPIVREQ